MKHEKWTINVPELSKTLSAEFAKGPILENGYRYLEEQTVAYIEGTGLKVQIFANEHPPPHFRVQYAGETANFSIKDCTRINGKLDCWRNTIKKWHKENKNKLIEAWDSNRPSDCPVGIYQEI